MAAHKFNNIIHNNELVEKTIIGPLENVTTVLKVLKKYQFNEKFDTVDIRDYFAPLKPGESLKAYRMRESLTQVQLSKKSGILQQHISEMENGKRAIGKKNAVKLAGILNCDYRQFM